MANTSYSFSCTLSLIPLIFIVVWSLGIARYEHKDTMDHAMQYAIAELAMNCVLFLTALFGCIELMLLLLGVFGIGYMIVNVVLLGVGFGWFKVLTGYTIFEMYSQLGHNAWLSLPLIQGAMYFNLWFTLVVSALSAFGLALTGFSLLCSVGRECSPGSRA